MKGGYTGKILKVNLSKKSVSTTDTEKYEDFGGGHGIGSAIFFDLAGKKLPFKAFDPENVITIMTGPFSGVMVPAAGGRCEVQGLGPQGYPTEWFTRSNFGGHFASQLKYAGWDGIIITGAANEPVWINIINDKVKIEKARGIWGLDTIETQEEICRHVMPGARFGEWTEVGTEYTTQLPAILCIGPAGENKIRIASLVHGAGYNASQAGFGGVWGSKNLKAVSVIGTGSIPVADPKALMNARMWFRKFQWNVDDPFDKKMEHLFFGLFNGAPGFGNTHNTRIPLEPARNVACAACHRACRQRLAGGIGNESSCASTLSFMGMKGTRKDKERATNLMQGYGLNAWEIASMQMYLQGLHQRRLLGPGKDIECELPMELFGKMEFVETLMRKIAVREGIGNDLSNGLARAAEKWGRYKEDTGSGLLNLPYWGYPEHYDPRVEVEWSYGTILGDRDIMGHTFNYPLHWMPQMMTFARQSPYLPADEATKIIASKMIPYEGDQNMLDYGEGETGIYSKHKVKQVAWHRHYTRFWIDSIIFCEWMWPLFYTPNTQDKMGPTPEAEPRFFNAVTGKNIKFADGVETGRKIWNLDKSIWVLQGRHRDMEQFAGYVYNVPSWMPTTLPVKSDFGGWYYAQNTGRKLDKKKFEKWKTMFYEFEGWNTENGWPKRKTLEELGLKKVADRLQKENKLG